MASRPDRAINMALRVRGISDVERDFQRVGKAGTSTLEKIELAAQSSDQALRNYAAQLQRVATEAKGIFESTPGVAEARKVDPVGFGQTRERFIADAVEKEQGRLRAEALKEATRASDDYGASLGRLAALSGAALTGLYALSRGTVASLEAFAEHQRLLDGFEATLRLTGNQSDATAGEIEDMATRIVDATLQTQESALEAAAALAQVPGMTREGLDEALDAAARLADALNTDVASVVNEIVRPAFEALAQGDLKEFATVTDGVVNDSLRNLVIKLAETGKTADAQRVFLKGLRDAAGDGPEGLTTATNRLSDAWDRFKRSLGENVAPLVIPFLERFADKLDEIRLKADAANVSVARVLLLKATNRGLFDALPTEAREGYGPGMVGQLLPQTINIARRQLMRMRGIQAGLARREIEDRFAEGSSGGGGAGGGGGSGGGSPGGASALQREAETARNAADRVIAANDEVIESQRRRTAEIEEKVGLEAEALAAVERRHEIEAAVRRINTDLVEKEIEAMRAEAAAAGEAFDATQAAAVATAKLTEQKDAVRELAEQFVDAKEALAEFNRHERQAAIILERLETPIDRIHESVDAAIEALRAGTITVDQFDAYMKRLSYDLGEQRRLLDEGALAWEGFGDDVGRTLGDIVLNGGSAKDILRELLRLPLERFVYHNVERPVAAPIDRVTGNDPEANAAKALESLPEGRRILGAFSEVTGETTAAAVSMGRLTLSADAAALALNRVAVAGSVGSSVAAGAGKSGGFFGKLAGTLFSAVAGGPSAGEVARLLPSAAATIAGNPSLFASGTPSVPAGADFWVGENGRERMRYHGGGRLEVLSHQQSHRAAGGERVLRVEVDKSDYFNVAVREISGGVTRDAFTEYDRVSGAQVQDNIARFG